MPIVFSLATLNIMSRWAFNNSLPGFLLGGYTTGYSASGGSTASITLKETLAGLTGTTPVSEQIGKNLKTGVLMGVGGLIAVKVAQKLVVSLGVNRSINKLTDATGLSSTVRAN